MKNRIFTLSIREIKSQFFRFLSLLVMAFLGVFVYVGLKSAAPDMLKSLDDAYDEAEDMLGSLNKVVYILIVLSMLLSFTVLYNLSNININ